jgi:hypothetical protein
VAGADTENPTSPAVSSAARASSDVTMLAWSTPANAASQVMKRRRQYDHQPCPTIGTCRDADR